MKKRLVQKLRLAQEPHAVASGDPVAAEVLGVAVGGGGLRAVIEGGVHLTEVVHIEHVVGVEDEKRLIVAVGVLLPDGLQAVIERIALPHQLVVAAGEHDGAGLAGHVGRVISAVVGDDEDVDELGGIVLHLDGVDEVGDDRLLIARRHHDRVAVVGARHLLRCPARQHHEHVEKLVGIANSEGKKHAEIEDVNEGQRRHLRCCGIEHLEAPRT